MHDGCEDIENNNGSFCQCKEWRMMRCFSFSGIVRQTPRPTAVQWQWHTFAKLRRALISRLQFFFFSCSSRFCSTNIIFFFRLPHSTWFITVKNEKASTPVITSERQLAKSEATLFSRAKIDNNLMTFNYVEFFISVSDILAFSFQPADTTR